jgi:hypothetical protein
MRSVSELTLFVSGALVMGYAASALFFLKFRLRTGSQLFGWFAAAFVLLAVQRMMLSLLAPDTGLARWSYVLRLVAFLLILWGIVRHNLDGPRDRS